MSNDWYCSGAEAMRSRGVVEQCVHVAVRCECERRGRGGGGGGGRVPGALARAAPRALRRLQHAHRARLAPAPAPASAPATSRAATALGARHVVLRAAPRPHSNLDPIPSVKLLNGWTVRPNRCLRTLKWIGRTEHFTNNKFEQLASSGSESRFGSEMISCETPLLIFTKVTDLRSGRHRLPRWKRNVNICKRVAKSIMNDIVTLCRETNEDNIYRHFRPDVVL